jgi:hypothetical protein
MESPKFVTQRTAACCVALTSTVVLLLLATLELVPVLLAVDVVVVEFVALVDAVPGAVAVLLLLTTAKPVEHPVGPATNSAAALTTIRAVLKQRC